jgi:hypothetical protein
MGNTAYMGILAIFCGKSAHRTLSVHPATAFAARRKFAHLGVKKRAVLKTRMKMWRALVCSFFERPAEMY